MSSTVSSTAFRAVTALLLPAVAACAGEVESGATANEATQAGVAGPFTLTSSAFVESGPIPARFTGDGENVSPPLEWSGAPEGTRSLTLVLVDPDVAMAGHVLAATTLSGYFGN